MGNDNSNTTALARLSIEGPAPVTIYQETAGQAMAAQSKAMIEARYIVAMKQPRDFDQVREKLLKECRRPSFAAVARYNKPVGKGIVGPSIRFAEAALRCMTNVVIQTTTVYDDGEKRIVHVEVCDLEANVPYGQDITITKTVERRKVKDGDQVLRSRKNSYGDTVHIIVADDDEILNKQNALISKAIRTLGLRLIPGDLIDEAEEVIVETLRKKDSEDPDAAKRKLFDAFGVQGVTVEQIKEYLGTDAATLTPKELADLRGFYSALKDGETTWRGVMELRDQQKKPANNADALKAALGQQQPAPVATPTQPQQPSDPAGDKLAQMVSNGANPLATTPATSQKPADPGEIKFTVRGKKDKAVGLYEKVFELASKVSPDALKRACENLGIQLGAVTRDSTRLAEIKDELERLAFEQAQET
jgi:hypothetical protein